MDTAAVVDRGPTRPSSPLPAVPTSLARSLTVTFAVICGLVYTSWPLGYVLNPSIARGDLASDLESSGQPWSWLFVSFDVATGVAAIAATIAAVCSIRRRSDRAGRIALGWYLLFGVATAVDALIPLHCPGAPNGLCSFDLSSLNVDDVLTGVADFALFAGSVGVLVGPVRRIGSPRLFAASTAIVVAWAVCGLIFLREHFSANAPVTLQHVLLTLSGVLAVGVPIGAVSARVHHTGT